jgi:hypothetical protein
MQAVPRARVMPLAEIIAFVSTLPAGAPEREHS